MGAITDYILGTEAGASQKELGKFLQSFTSSKNEGFFSKLKSSKVFVYELGLIIKSSMGNGLIQNETIIRFEDVGGIIYHYERKKVYGIGMMLALVFWIIDRHGKVLFKTGANLYHPDNREKWPYEAHVADFVYSVWKPHFLQRIKKEYQAHGRMTFQHQQMEEGPGTVKYIPQKIVIGNGWVEAGGYRYDSSSCKVAFVLNCMRLESPDFKGGWTVKGRCYPIEAPCIADRLIFCHYLKQLVGIDWPSTRTDVSCIS